MEYQKEKMLVMLMEQTMVDLNVLSMNVTRVFDNELRLADLMVSVWVILMEYQKEKVSVMSMEQTMFDLNFLRMDATRVFENELRLADLMYYVWVILMMYRKEKVSILSEKMLEKKKVYRSHECRYQMKKSMGHQRH